MAVGNVKGFRVKKGDETGIAKIATEAILDKAVTKAKLAQAVQDEVDKVKDKADQDGNYDGLTAGGAKQLLSTVYADDNEPYNFRTAGGSADIGDRMYEEVVGGTVAWNQLCNGSSVTVQNGHKYIAKTGSTWTVGASIGTAISNLTSGSDMVFDLTQMFGSTIADYIYSLEQGTAGAGVAWFRKLFPKPYYEYNAGELMSVKAGSHDTVGFNQFDKTAAVTGERFIPAGVGGVNNTYARSAYIKCVPNATYYFKNIVTTKSSYSAVFWYDAQKNYINADSKSDSINDRGNLRLTAPKNAYYIGVNLLSEDINTCCVSLSWDGERDGEYELYEKHTYPLAELELRGIPKLDANNQLYYDGDTYASDGTVTRKYGVRAYQSGDESLADAISDGTNTVYKLSTPTTETADTYVNPQVVDDFGTEEYTDYAVEAGDRDVAIPVGHNSQYMNNLRAKLEMAPDSPSGDGKYIVQQSNGENAYIPYTADGRLDAVEAKLPAPPSANGTYKLTATVTDGNVTYTWVAG